MGFNKKFFTSGGIAASSPAATSPADDPFSHFESVAYTGNGGTQKITGYIRKGASFNGSSSIMYINSFNPTTTFSVSIWFKTSSVNAVLANNGGGETGSTGFLLLLDANGKILLATSQSTNSTGTEITILVLSSTL